jgi:ketosteroid isomerase-like protein
MKNVRSKTILVLVTIALWVTGNLHAQDKAVSPDETALIKLENDWMNAENRHDAVALNSILSDKFIATFATDKAIDKHTYLKNLTDGAIDPTAQQEIVNENVVIDTNTAVIVLINTIRGTRKGKPFDVAYRITVTFIKNGDHWNALALQGISIKP